MRARVLLLTLLAACQGGPAGPARPRPAAGPGEEEPGEAQPTAELEALLPLGRERVLWYRASQPGRPPRRVPFYVHLGRDPREGPSWRSLGPGAGPAGLWVWRSPWAVWLLPGGFGPGAPDEGPGEEHEQPPHEGQARALSPAFRVWTPAAAWDRGLGRRVGSEVQDTPAGRFECLRTEHGGPAALRVTWLARGVGLVAFEQRRNGATLRRLELVEVAPRGAPAEGAYRRATPDELWASVVEALRRLDAGGVERLMSAALFARARRPAPPEPGALPGPRRQAEAPADPDAARIEAALTELVTLDPARTGPWTVAGEEASAEGELLRDGQRVPCRLVLRRGAEGWRWEDLVVEAE